MRINPMKLRLEGFVQVVKLTAAKKVRLKWKPTQRGGG
ncbi:hypothetical protein HDF17_000022 [Granulicella arctica]|uniref:Uncharacterized protein n=1 Tax=Granulicella arctica TaxID=940613 RepID=A0A7Y9PD45_9BACT|nr:hypothetical protein [Granulicella arctica]